MIRSLLVPVLVLTALATVVAAVLAGGEGAAGAAIGGLLVCAFMGSSPYVLGVITEGTPKYTVAAVLGFFAVKCVVVVVLLMILLGVGNSDDWIDVRALGFTILVTSGLWTILQIRAYGKDRTPLYDLTEDD